MAYLIKVSLLLILTRVFRPHKKTIIFVYAFMGAMLAYYVPVLIIKVRICAPISGLWNPNAHATCMNQRALFTADTVMSAVTDLAVLILPIPLTWSLQVPLRKKLKIIALLGAGGVATASSIVRLILVIHLGSSADETTTFVRFNLLGYVQHQFSHFSLLQPR
jgi:hypothetical protein